MLVVKRGDRYPTLWVVRDDKGAPLDITGSTVRMIARTAHSDPIVLSASLGDPALGQVIHILDGTLLVGIYSVEIELTRADEIRTAPTEGFQNLRVVPDLD